MSSLSSTMGIQFDASQRWKNLSLLWSIVQVIFFGVTVLIALLAVNFNPQLLPERAQIELYVLVIVIPILLLLSIVQAQTSYHQGASRRQQILTGEWREQAAFQPSFQQQNAQLTAPITLKIRINRGPIIINVALILLCFSGILLLLWSMYSMWASYLERYGTTATSAALDAWLFYVFLAAIWWIAWITLGFLVNLRLRRWLCPELEAMEEGLIAWYPGQEVMIPWNNIRYFALVKRHKASSDPKDWTYEVSDGEKSIRWQQPYIAKRLYPLCVPELPQVQYEQEFARLLALIVAKTGQPLLDMHLK
ncbi:hypothetical protein [Ktedonospora formicarum]|uniref:Uncharacterized protein n=1 Tax=Ktedonospora formicarum TaxID=2778364 RepID=A0A8J3MW46_9CHLR|nr:hypothetical protein [Ktedonospora formicarum]GHO51057.1 hypothetical protein KSX_92200 [Ktedonospora formicarum]